MTFTIRGIEVYFKNKAANKSILFFFYFSLEYRKGSCLYNV